MRFLSLLGRWIATPGKVENLDQKAGNHRRFLIVSRIASFQRTLSINPLLLATNVKQFYAHAIRGQDREFGLPCRSSSVKDHIGTGHIRRCIGNQEDDGGLVLILMCHACQGNQLGQALDKARILAYIHPS